MTANKKTIDFGYTKTMLKTDQNNPVVKEYVDAMKRGTNPNPTEKRDSVIQKKKIMLHKTKEHATDVIPNPTVESWERKFDKEFCDEEGEFIGDFQGVWFSPKELKSFIFTQIQQAEERGKKEFEDGYKRKYELGGEMHFLPAHPMGENPNCKCYRPLKEEHDK